MGNSGCSGEGGGVRKGRGGGTEERPGAAGGWEGVGGGGWGWGVRGGTIHSGSEPIQPEKSKRQPAVPHFLRRRLLGFALSRFAVRHAVPRVTLLPDAHAWRPRAVHDDVAADSTA